MPPTTRDVVLLLTHSGDFYTVDLVAQALAHRNVRAIRFNTDLFPSVINSPLAPATNALHNHHGNRKADFHRRGARGLRG